MQQDPRHELFRLRRLLNMLRVEVRKALNDARSERTVTTDKPQENDEILAQLGQGEWKRYVVSRSERN